MAIQLQNNGKIESKKIQIFQFTDNGFLLDTCDTIINLLKYRSSSLYDLLPFLKRYRRVIKGLEEGKVKQFKGIRLDFNEKNHLFNVAFSRYNGQLTCMLEENSHKTTKELSLPLGDSRIQQENKLLKRDLDQMKQIQKIRMDLFSKIIHDIKLPLTEIVGTTYLLKQYVDEDKGETYLNALSCAAGNLNRMLNDLMEFSKSEAYKFNLEYHNFSLTNTLISVINAFAFKTKEKNVLILTDFDPNIPKNIQGDATRLSQVVYNLLDNALKFTHSGHIEVKTSLKEIKQEECLIGFEIADSGIGIPQESLNAIFESYNQVNEKDAQNGFGLGLSIVKQLVELQGGQVSVSSQLGEGTCFHFSLPFGRG